jgi:hypothetical protein
LPQGFLMVTDMYPSPILIGFQSVYALKILKDMGYGWISVIIEDSKI